MVLLGGLEIVAAGYLLKEIAGDSKAEEEQRERERERRRKRRHHSREDGRHSHRYDDSPDRPSRPPSQGLHPPQNPGPQRPYSAPPPQSRPPMMAPVPVPAAMFQPQPRPQQPQFSPGPQGPMQSHGTWPVMQQQRPPQMPQMPPQQQPFVPPYLNPATNNSNNANFVPPPLQRPQTMYPPPGVHIDLKTGKIQHNMLPPEMPQGKRDLSPPSPPLSRQNTSGSYERRRTNSGFSDQARPQFGGVYGEQGYSNSQPQITISGHGVAQQQGYVELDSETPGRYKSYGNEKASQSTGSGRHKSNSFSSRRYRDDYDTEMRDPPPAYRE